MFLETVIIKAGQDKNPDYSPNSNQIIYVVGRVQMEMQKSCKLFQISLVSLFNGVMQWVRPG